MSTDSAETRGTNAPSRLGLVLAVCCAGQFLVVLDASVVNVALPSIKEALGLEPSSLQWVINAYTIVFAGFLLLGGRLADLFGRRRVLLGGIALFSVASLAGGLAFGPTSLLLARGFQGLGAAVMAPATLTVIFTSFTDAKERARAFGMWSAVAAAGGAVGVLIGGAITQWLSWRWILLVNVPVGALLFGLALYAVRESRREDANRRIDTLGSVAITGGLMALVYGAVQALEKGWGSPEVLTVLGVGVVLLAFFVVNEAKLASNPLVPLSIFRNRSVTAGNIVAFSSSAALWGTFYLFTLLLQLVLRYGPMETGLAYLPLSLGIFFAARQIAKHVPSIGARPVLVTGLALSAAGLLWLGFTGAGASFWADLFVPTLILGIGQGLVSASVTVASTTGVSYAEAGLVSGLLNTSRQVGGAVGLAVLAVIAQSQAGGSTDPGVLADGYGLAFLVSAAFPVLGIVAALMVPAPERPAETAGASKETPQAGTKQEVDA
ncbi:MFS transporter [Pseudonocardia endophytica]|uniref:EmrB/QacA subfamily drug resistance transporter n=1 Tax=Pseudonocardia endophytica TaxID=401976 RepID=A0A4R1HNN3_PSEEN|nr:MFS transporter [Pseudonocardia endophytica]TCK22215.1 EmrB/QacA subfamily drug resistance transporter [Pseudonocardia endophytica]